MDNFNIPQQQQNNFNPSSIDPIQIADEEIKRLYHYSNPQNLQQQYRNSPQAQEFISQNRRQLMEMLGYRKQMMQLKQQEDYNQGRLNLEQQKLGMKYPQQTETNKPTRQNVSGGYMDIGGQRTYFPKAGTVNTTQDKRAWNEYYAGQRGVPSEYETKPEAPQYTSKEALDIAKIRDIEIKQQERAEDRAFRQWKAEQDLRSKLEKQKELEKSSVNKQGASTQRNIYKAKGKYQTAMQGYNKLLNNDKYLQSLKRGYEQYKGQRVDIGYDDKGNLKVSGGDIDSPIMDDNLYNAYKQDRLSQLEQMMPTEEAYRNQMGLPGVSGFFGNIDFNTKGFKPSLDVVRQKR